MATTPDLHAGGLGFKSRCRPTKKFGAQTPPYPASRSQRCVKGPSPPKGAMWDGVRRRPSTRDDKKYIKEITPFALFLVRVEEVSVVAFGADLSVHRESVQVGAGGDPGADAKVGGDRQGLQDPATV